MSDEGEISDSRGSEYEVEMRVKMSMKIKVSPGMLRRAVS
jgi:hypothetical protein